MPTKTPTSKSSRATKPSRAAASAPAGHLLIRPNPIPVGAFGFAAQLAAAFSFPSLEGAELLSAEKLVALLDETQQERRLKSMGLMQRAGWIAEERRNHFEEWIGKMTARKDEANEVRRQDGESPWRIATMNAKWNELVGRLRAVVNYAFSTGRDVKSEVLSIASELTEFARCAKPLAPMH